MIRKTILTLTFIAATSVWAHATEDSDTVVAVEKPQNVTVINNGKSKKIIISGRAGDPNYRFVYESAVTDSTESTNIEQWDFSTPFIKPAKNKKNKKSPYSDGFCDIYSGAVIPSDGARGMNRTGWEIGMLNVMKGAYCLTPSTELSIGLGWYYRSLPIGQGLMVDSENGNIQLNPIPAELKNAKSSISSFGIQIPVLLYQNIYKRFGIEIGAIANFNTYTTAKTTWQDNKIGYKASHKGLHQRILSVDWIARIGFRGSVAAYVRYSPMSVFKPQHGPDYDTVSIGLSLGY